MKILILLYFLSFVAGDYCECVVVPFDSKNPKGYEVRYHFKRSDLVIYGKVLEINDRHMPGYENVFFPENHEPTEAMGSFPLISVEKVYKGRIKGKEVQIYQDWSNCDATFKKGHQYLIMAQKEGGKFYTSTCIYVKEIRSQQQLQTLIKYGKLKRN